MNRNDSGSTRSIVTGILCAMGLLLIVAAIVFPIFARERVPVPRTSCQNYMKELGTALNMYTGDYDDMLPSSCLYRRSKSWNRSDFIHFASERGVTPPELAPNHPMTMNMLLYPYMKNKDIIWCPSDLTKSERDTATISYFYKAAIDRAWYGDGKMKMKKRSDFLFASDQVAFYEHTDWHHGDGDRGFADGVKLNMLYLDGHVATKRIANSGGSAVTPAPAAGEPAWFNYSVDKEQTSTGANWNPKHWCDRLE